MSIAFTLIWSYIGYKVGKVSDNSFKNIGFTHLIPIMFVIIQFLVSLYTTAINTYTFSLVSQFYLLPIANLIAGIFSFTSETIIVISFILMITVFSLGTYVKR